MSIRILFHTQFGSQVFAYVWHLDTLQASLSSSHKMCRILLITNKIQKNTKGYLARTLTISIRQFTCFLKAVVPGELVFESQSDSDSNSTDSTLSRTSSLTLSQLLVPQVSVPLCTKTQFPILIRSLCVSKFFSSLVPQFD